MCRRTEEEEGRPPPAPPGSRGQGGGGGGGCGGRVQPGEPLSGESLKQTHTLLPPLFCLCAATAFATVRSDLRGT